MFFLNLGADNPTEKKVFFLCLVGTETSEEAKGLPTKEHFLFDVESELELWM